ncbi:hypothetical protein U9M48_037369 [Paspalum notatum var. saurae]|uniref:DUF4005 domain-containing protein n=1 Tax=Paspalum notatum var. saurae TaxID=547442 RepID=A0AAQ3UL29_PASNO
MGKAGRWLRSFFFLAGRKGRRAKDRADTDCQSVVSAPSHAQPATTPSSGRERRRWSFRHAAAKADAGQGPLGSGPSSSHCFSEAEVRAAAAATATATACAGTDTDASVSAPAASAPGEEAAAAVRIQSAFRAYLARKALCALRGMVKLQAMVRGQLVRRQAAVTLRRMQALLDAQSRARAERLRLRLLDDGAATLRRRSPEHPRSRKLVSSGCVQDAVEDVKTVVVDGGGGAQRARSSSYHATTPSRTPAAAELLYQKVSPTPSALTDASARTLSGRLDDASASDAPSRRKAAWRADHALTPAALLLPSYMANTESSRAKARSQSAPRQRLSSASETEAAAASPSPSCCCERPPSGGGGRARRRASLDPMDLPGAARSSAGCVERCASRARLGAISSLPGGECGSSSTGGHRGSARGAWHG